jgi:hypothetical protein
MPFRGSRHAGTGAETVLTNRPAWSDDVEADTMNGSTGTGLIRAGFIKAGFIKAGLFIPMLALAMLSGSGVEARPPAFPTCDAGNLGETYTAFHDNGNGTWYYFYYQCGAGGWMPTGGDYCFFTNQGSGSYACIPL